MQARWQRAREKAVANGEEWRLPKMPRLCASSSGRKRKACIVHRSVILLLMVMARCHGLQLLPRALHGGLASNGSKSRNASVSAPIFVHHEARSILFMSTDSSDSSSSTDETEATTRKQQYTVSWETANGTVEFPAYEGETLRTAALRRGIVSPHNGKAQLINCRGLGTCGTCAVEIQSGKIPAKRNLKEKLRLSFPPHGSEDQSPNLRLACQIQVQSDMEVTKRSGFWGQDPEALSTSQECTTYFGDLEYILDDKSPDDLDEGDDGDRKSAS